MQSIVKKLGPVAAIIGGQWGDEGKGKLVDILAEEYDIVGRATGGANAGHTIYVGKKKFVFHLIPAGMLHPKKICVMGNGMVINLPSLAEEADALEKSGIRIGKRLLISDRAHIVFEYHKIIDRLQEEMKGGKKVGTTGRGIGPSYSDKIARSGFRMGDLRNFDAFRERFLAHIEMLKKMYGISYDVEKELKEIKAYAKRFLPFVTDTSLFLAQQRTKRKTILMEGANGTLLDVDHGTYPFVTSSNASIGGVISGAGIAPREIKSVIAIVKAYTTRVGSGPFPTELNDALGEEIRKIGNEYGATTGRPRRCGWFDAVAVRYAVRINGCTDINLTKVDVLNSLPKIKIAVAYEYKGKRYTEFPSDLTVLENAKVIYKEVPGWKQDISKARTFKQLPKACQNYIRLLEKMVGCPMTFIGTGIERTALITR
ncbi:adenylosuccinate synthase [Candidatus Gracilibacteria bacterium]|nr:adenylosuccinate synthase [Candidatus Gracilibacteria bacterium]